MKKTLFLYVLLSILIPVKGFSESSKINKHAGMVLIQAKNRSFTIGLDTADLHPSEPRKGWAYYIGKHSVTFTYNFYMDSTLVTQGDYLKLVGNNPSSHVTGNMKLPVEKVSWFDAVLYCNARSKRDKLDSVYTYTSFVHQGNAAINIENLTFNIKKNGYRLPTNAEYEYAERANTTGEHFFVSNKEEANQKGPEYAWSIFNSGATYKTTEAFTHEVAGKKPNPWGLYDIVGNVFEWCNDWDAPYATAPEIDPVGQATGPQGNKIGKGGSYRTEIYGHMRIAYHYKWKPENITGEIGFRCVATK